MHRFVVFTVFISFFVALPASAQFVRTHSVVLLPIVIEEPIAGAFGSEWVTEIVARNTANVPVRHFVHCPPNIQCLEQRIEPNSTFTPQLQRPHSPSGHLVTMDPEGDAVVFSLRVRDLSRQFDTWGTEIPTVRLDEALTVPAHFLDLPADEHFRLTLRLYDLTPGSFGRGTFAIRIYSQATNALLRDFIAETAPVPDGSFGFLLLSDPLPVNHAHQGRIRIEVEPLNANTRYWTFASVTNNETQHVTVAPPKTPFVPR